MQFTENQVHDILGSMGDPAPLDLNVLGVAPGAEFERRRKLRQLVEEIVQSDDRVPTEIEEMGDAGSRHIYTFANGLMRLIQDELYDGDEWIVQIRTPDTDFEDVTVITGIWHTRLRQELKLLALTKPQPEVSKTVRDFWEGASA